MKGKSACLFLSGGSDSLLLLNVLLDMKSDFSLLTFDATFSPRQKRVIDGLVYEHGLRVYSYKPRTAYFVGDAGSLAFVEEYALPDGTAVPFIRDCVAGEKCSFDVTVETRPSVPIAFELYLFGTRHSDWHWSFGNAFGSPRVKLRCGEIFAPLWEWSKSDVRAGLNSYGLRKPKVDTGDYEFCTACLAGKGQVFCPKQQKEIEAVDWDARAMLDAFREKFRKEKTV